MEVAVVGEVDSFGFLFVREHLSSCEDVDVPVWKSPKVNIPSLNESSLWARYEKGSYMEGESRWWMGQAYHILPEQNHDNSFVMLTERLASALLVSPPLLPVLPCYQTSRPTRCLPNNTPLRLKTRTCIFKAFSKNITLETRITGESLNYFNSLAYKVHADMKRSTAFK